VIDSAKDSINEPQDGRKAGRMQRNDVAAQVDVEKPVGVNTRATVHTDGRHRDARLAKPSISLLDGDVAPASLPAVR
jgi:hypothetical protein